jgi:hypothetical protein
MNDQMILTEEHTKFLVQLRDSGVTNMWMAAPFIQDEFGVSKREAKDILLAWFATFKEMK